MKATIDLNSLKGAAVCAAKKDARYYLQGVLVEFKGDKAVMVGTDGSTLFAAESRLEWDGEAQAPLSMIVPIEAIKGAKHGCIESLDDGRYMLGDVVFTAIDGVYPDWRRVVPTNLSYETAQYNPDLLQRAQEALRKHYNNKKMLCWMKYNGSGAGIMHGDDNSALVAVMPLRENLMSKFSVRHF